MTMMKKILLNIMIYLKNKNKGGLVVYEEKR